MSAPITTIFAPVITDRVRYVIDTCSTLEPAELAAYQDRANHPEAVTRYPGHGWLYEIEVFARLPRHQAWWRSLTED
jgi:hypothetical protein